MNRSETPTGCPDAHFGGNNLIAYNRLPASEITQFQVLGERCTGTNYMRFLLERNTQLAGTRKYGWTHGFPGFTAIFPTDLIVIMAREPESWLKSLYTKPFHVPDEFTNISFSEFLRSPWITVLDRPRGMSALRGRKALGLPAQADRHPITGTPPANPVQLRNTKHAAFWGILNRDCNVALVRHSDLIGNPQAVLRAIRDVFDLKINAGELILPSTWLGKFGRTLSGPRRSEPVFTQEDRDFLSNELDHEMEGRLGFSSFR